MTKPDTRPELVAGAKRFLAHWPDDTIEGAAVHTLLAHCAETEAEVNKLVSAIGEHVTVRGQYLARAELAEQRLAAAVEGIRRLGSMQAFAIGRVIRPLEDAELLARVDYARALLPPADGGEHG